MTETRKKYSLIEQEYTTFIRGLIESAVANPMQDYKQATVAELGRSASALVETRDALSRYLEHSGERLKSQLAPLRDAVEDLNFKVEAISARVQEVAPSNGLNDTLSRIGERLKAIEAGFASDPNPRRPEAADPGRQRDDATNKLRDEVRTLLRQLEDRVANMAETLPDIPRQLTEQRAASDGIGRQVGELYARLDEQVWMLVSELKQSSQGVAGATLDFIKETETRLDGRLMKLGEAVASSAEGVGMEFPPLHERLGELNSLAADQQGRLERLAARAEAAQSENAAGFDAMLSDLTRAEQSLGLLISDKVESAVARLAGGQADASQKIIERADAVGAGMRESAEFIALEIEETRRRIDAATADTRAQLGGQIAQTTDGLTALLTDLRSGHAQTWQEVDGLRARLKELSGDVNRTREQLDSLRLTVVELGAGVRSSLKASDDDASRRLQSFAAELKKAFGGRFDQQAEESRADAARLQAAFKGHVTDLQKAIGASTEALRQGLNNSMELSRTIGREGADARTTLQRRVDRANVEQQNLKRFMKVLFGFTAFNSLGIIATLLYLLFSASN